MDLTGNRFRVRGGLLQGQQFFSGLADYSVLPINANALERLFGALGEQLILVAPPVGAGQIQLDKDHGLEKIGGPFVRQLTAKFGIPFLADFGSGLSLSGAAFDENCDHLTLPEDHLSVARAIVKLIK